MTAAAKPVMVIEPIGSHVHLNLGELWRYRELVGLLVWRDLSSKYRQSVIGFGWVFLRPLFTLIVYTFVFGRIANLTPDGVPSALFILAGILPWNLFSQSVSSCAASIVTGASLWTKVYFPRLVLPLAAVAAALVDFLLTLLMIVPLYWWFQWSPTWTIVFLPIAILLTIVMSAAIGMVLTALNVKFRDVGQMLPFAVSLLMWLSPIVYATSSVPERWRFYYCLNPIVGMTELFRWTTLGLPITSWTAVTINIVTVIVAAFVGLYYFKSTERRFADIV